MTTSTVAEITAGRRPLLAGEIQFWRMEPETWRPAVRAARNSGIEVVSSYLSWRRHEPQQGQMDFTGSNDVRLNVRRFLEICADAGALVQIKPGPWICAEERGGGYPDWLLEKTHLLARDDSGEPILGYNPPFQHHVPSYLNEQYLKFVGAWFHSVWDELGKFLAPTGPIAFLQLDNEPSMCFQDSLYGADYSDSAIHEFQSWLGRRYGEIDALRLSWADLSIASFATATAPQRPPTGARPAHSAQIADWIEFTGWATGEYLSRLSQMHSNAGASVPVRTINLVTHPVHNIPISHAQVRAATTALVGEDHYYVPPLDTNDVHRLARSAATARAAKEPLPWVPELQAGIWRSPGEIVDYPDPTPVEQEAWWGAAVALGFGGFNFYMLSDRENWHDAPLLANGEFTEAAERIQTLTTLATRYPQAFTSAPTPDVIVAWHGPDAIDAYTVTGTSRAPIVAWHDPTLRSAYENWDATLLNLTSTGYRYDLWPTDDLVPQVPLDVPVVVPIGCGVAKEILTSIRDSGRRVVELESTDLTEVHQLIAHRGPLQVRGSNGLPISNTITSLRGQLLHIAHWGVGERGAIVHIEGMRALCNAVTLDYSAAVDGVVQIEIRPGYLAYIIDIV